MKRNSDRKAAGRGWPCMVTCIKWVSLSALIFILCGVSLMSIVAMVVVPALLDPIIGFLEACLLIGEILVYTIWFLLTGGWIQFVRLLPELLDWLRSVGLL